MPRINLENEHLIFRLAYEGKLAELQKIIAEDKTCIKMLASKGEKLIHMAAEGGHLETIQWLLAVDISTIREHNFFPGTALHHAAFYGNLNIVKWLLTKGGSQINERNQLGDTALTCAARGSHFDTIKWLLTQGKSQVNERNHFGDTALLIAAQRGDTHIVRWLLTEGGSTLTERNEFDQTALNRAAMHGNMDTFQYLLDHPAMTYKLLKSTQLNIDYAIEYTIDGAKIAQLKAGYTDFIQQANTDEEIQGLFKVTEQQVIIANKLFCPISLELIEDPVIASDGFLYEKTNIKEWFKSSDTSPITNLPLESKILYPERAIKKVLKDIDEAIETLFQKRRAENKTLLNRKKPIQKENSEPCLNAFFKREADDEKLEGHTSKYPRR